MLALFFSSLFLSFVTQAGGVRFSCLREGKEGGNEGGKEVLVWGKNAEDGGKRLRWGWVRWTKGGK